MSFHGIVVAAGRGERFGAPKASVKLGDLPLWQWAVRCLESAGAVGVVVVGAVPGGLSGGERRRDSVAAGLAAVPPGTRHILIHDAARPLASAALASAVAARLARGDCEGVVPALPVRDTLKQVAGERVATTVARHDLVAVQTPQGFVLDALLRAHAAFDGDATDDAELVERNGGSVVTVPGEPRNLKITFPDDLDLAVALLS